MVDADSNNLDYILRKLDRKIGIYQIKNYIFICIPMVYAAMFALNYVFTARNLDYRCHIPECDSPYPTYKPFWLNNAVPVAKSGTPSRCDRYQPIGINSTDHNSCPVTLFKRNSTLRCDKFVFDTVDVTILNEFDLMCDENMWKLTLVGTINNIGQFACMPLAGFISDRFGRRFLLLGGLIIGTIIGVARSFSPSYAFFLIFEFLQTAIGSGACYGSGFILGIFGRRFLLLGGLIIGTIIGVARSFSHSYAFFLIFEFLQTAIGSGACYGSGFILGVEQVSPEKRVLSSAIVSSAYAVGESIVGIIAMYTTSWRWLLRFIHLPGVLLLGFFWLTPESIRWMLAKGKGEEVKTILTEAAKENKIEISEESFNLLNVTDRKQEGEKITYPFRDIFKSKILLLRLMSCSLCWVTCAFVFYGLSLYSVALAGNLYLNFIFVSLIEIPAYFITYLVLDRFGRRISLCVSLLLSGFACFSFIFISEDATWTRISAFMVGKFAITISFTTIYVYTTELFPTPLRHSSLATCAMVGRIGSMVAPQTPLLAEITHSLPLILFGTMSIASGLSAYTFPETLNTKLPDTIQEAEYIGTRKEKNNPSSYTTKDMTLSDI